MCNNGNYINSDEIGNDLIIFIQVVKVRLVVIFVDNNCGVPGHIDGSPP